MAVNISEDCIGCGTCEGVCADVFEMNDDGIAQVKAGVDEATFASEIDEAIEACPVEAISK